jgi:hypothetical protein
MHPRSKEATSTGAHKMAFLKLISKLFPKQQSSLEQFIVSKRPLNAADVEHWTRRYYEGQARGL